MLFFHEVAQKAWVVRHAMSHRHALEPCMPSMIVDWMGALHRLVGRLKRSSSTQLHCHRGDHSTDPVYDKFTQNFIGDNRRLAQVASSPSAPSSHTPS